MRFMPNIKMNKVEDGAAGGGQKENPPATEVQKSGEPAKETGDTLDEYGYKVSPEASKDKPKEEPPKDAPKEEIEKPVTGYGKEPPAVEEPPKEEPPKDASEKVGPDDLKLNVEGLYEENIKHIKDFAKKYALTKEAAQGMADDKKAENKRLIQAIEDRRKQEKIDRDTLKRKWYNELKSDPNFGGEKFEFNVNRAEKIVDKFMPDLKKVLTDQGSMLPAYVMKGLANVANHLYSSEKLTQGEPLATGKDKETDDDPLAFYNSKEN